MQKFRYLWWVWMCPCICTFLSIINKYTTAVFYHATARNFISASQLSLKSNSHNGTFPTGCSTIRVSSPAVQTTCPALYSAVSTVRGSDFSLFKILWRLWVFWQMCYHTLLDMNQQVKNVLQKQTSLSSNSSQHIVSYLLHPFPLW